MAIYKSRRNRQFVEPATTWLPAKKTECGLVVKKLIRIRISITQYIFRYYHPQVNYVSKSKSVSMQIDP